MKLFISYRRVDSTHAANRVRLLLQQKFGAGSVFIDREIPAGREWNEHLRQMLDESTGVVVMIGDEFLRKLRRHRPNEEPDPLVWEIATAIELKKPIYPVLFGSIDMPDESQLPEEIRAFARYQAVFAREPAFDTAIAMMIKSIADDHGWVDPPAAAATGAAAPPLTAWVLSMLLVALAAVLSLWGAGRLILWMALGDAAARPAESAFWHGLRYALTTAVWGLGPYLAYWQVAELRARARLPIRNLHGLLSVANATGVLVLGGTFLLMSTLPEWRLQPLWVFPPHPRGEHYALLAAGMLAMVVLTAGFAVWEPRVRTWPAERRAWGMHGINGVSGLLVLFMTWLAASLVASLPARVFALNEAELVPMVGYPGLCLAISPLVAGYAYARSGLGLRARDWQNLALFALLLGLVLACTLALFAFGPTRLLAGEA
ncbi:MAG: toll/interleukin-1 receptor domain-containing protein [Piscinibacter sp.]|nr:toll/interleukin-1 receptor domain-containing protein [Piscinibacter sp.]